MVSREAVGYARTVPRTWRELVSEEDAIETIRSEASAAGTDVRLLEPSDGAGQRVLESLQVTTRSPLGAVAFHTGGILVDRGWLRILGGGSPRLPRALDTWNGTGAVAPRLDRGLLVADDAIGGFFAWFRQPQTLHYLAPDTARWEDLRLGYSDWLSWCFTERLAQFYEGLRWDGWADEVEPLYGDRALSLYPPLCAEGPPIARRSRRGVPIGELWELAIELHRTLNGEPAE